MPQPTSAVQYSWRESEDGACVLCFSRAVARIDSADHAPGRSSRLSRCCDLKLGSLQMKEEHYREQRPSNPAALARSCISDLIATCRKTRNSSISRAVF